MGLKNQIWVESSRFSVERWREREHDEHDLMAGEAPSREELRARLRSKTHAAAKKRRGGGAASDAAGEASGGASKWSGGAGPGAAGKQVRAVACQRAEQTIEGKAREQVRSRYANPCRRRRQTAFCCLYIRAPAQHLGRGSNRDARTHGQQRAGLCQLLIERRRWLPGEYCQPVQAQLHIGLTLRHRRAQGIQLRLRSHPIKLGTAAGIQPGGDDIQ